MKEKKINIVRKGDKKIIAVFRNKDEKEFIFDNGNKMVLRVIKGGKRELKG